jgi:uncharacterized glyoxalase superfamily protein PhnB
MSTSRISPYLLYADLDSALKWLARAFGLRERARRGLASVFVLRTPPPNAGPDGKPVHAEMALENDDGLILLGCPGPGYQNPKTLGHITQYLYISVDDVDQHFERAARAGALVFEKPADQPYGHRRYGVEDPEGHRWYFAQPIR